MTTISSSSVSLDIEQVDTSRRISSSDFLDIQHGDEDDEEQEEGEEVDDDDDDILDNGDTMMINGLDHDDTTNVLWISDQELHNAMKSSRNKIWKSFRSTMMKVMSSTTITTRGYYYGSSSFLEEASTTTATTRDADEKRILTESPAGTSSSTTPMTAEQEELQKVEDMSSTNTSRIDDISSDEHQQQRRRKKDTKDFHRICKKILHQQDKMWLVERMKRMEVYSHRYIPSKKELEEIIELETTIGPKQQHLNQLVSSIGTFLFGGNSHEQQEEQVHIVLPDYQIEHWNNLIHPAPVSTAGGSTKATNAGTTANQQQQQPILHSILLKRGPCLWLQDGIGTDVLENNVSPTEEKEEYDNTLERTIEINEQQKEGKQETNDQNKIKTMKNKKQPIECEVILFTRGLVIAKVLKQKNTKYTNNKNNNTLFSVSSKDNNNKQHDNKDDENEITISLEVCRVLLWSEIEYGTPNLLDPYTWEIQLKPWAIKGATTTTTSHNKNQHPTDNKNHYPPFGRYIFVCSTKQQRNYWIMAMEKVLIQYAMYLGPQPILGWQYRLIHKPAYTMAVTNIIDLVPPSYTILNHLDIYHGYTALHYAVRCQNLLAIKCLLKIGANPNEPDHDNCTPMYYASLDQVSNNILKVLQSYGGIPCISIETKNRGELFGQVQAVNIENEKRREIEAEQKIQAEQAQNEMSKNLQLMNERGQKIEDLGNKASELNQMANEYGSLAKQLKEKTKKQSQWGFSLF